MCISGIGPACLTTNGSADETIEPMATLIARAQNHPIFRGMPAAFLLAHPRCAPQHAARLMGTEPRAFWRTIGAHDELRFDPTIRSRLRAKGGAVILSQLAKDQADDFGMVIERLLALAGHEQRVADALRRASSDTVTRYVSRGLVATLLASEHPEIRRATFYALGGPAF